MTSTSIAPSSHYYSAAPSSDLPRAGTPLVKTEGELNKEFADALFRELVEAGAEAQPEVSQNRPVDVDAAQAAFEATLMAINTRTSTPYVAGTFAFNV